MLTRTQAAKELHALQTDYEVKPLKLTTVYRKIYFCNQTNNWRLIGKAHDYSV